MKKYQFIFYVLLISLFYSCATMNIQENPEKGAIVEQPEKVDFYNDYIEKAQSGDDSAQVKVGIAYNEGLGIDQNFNEALNWYQKAASKGNAEAYYRIGLMYMSGQGVDKNFDDALEWLYSAAASNYAPAIGALIDYYEGFDEEQYKWIQKGIEFNDPYSLYRYGLLIESENREEAIKYYYQASESDNVHAQALLSILSLGSKTQNLDNREAFENISLSAQEGNSRSQVVLAWLYEFAYFTEKDLHKAFTFYEEAARKNNQLGIYNLSRFYSDGIIVDSDPLLAGEFLMQLDSSVYSPSYLDLKNIAEVSNDNKQKQVLLRYGATMGDLEAQFQLGLQSNEEDAFQWFWISAQAGYVPSMVELAKLYRESDIIQAGLWIMMAENSGYNGSEISSEEILETMNDDEKLEVSRLFTELYFSN